MFELSRIRLFSVGPPGARYEDVLIDLSAAGRPVQHHQPSLFGGAPVRPSPASVLFLENGGGKSVLIKLIFSVLLPGRRQVVGTTNTRVLEKFVGADDVSHVILEWMHSETGKLLVTGKVSEWRGHSVSADVGKLEDRWYCFRPPSALDVDSLEFIDGERKLATATYLHQLQVRADQNPAMELFSTSTQEVWTKHLVTLGLDPELFRYQRDMNAGEGEAASAFKFTTDRAFVDFLLKAVMDQAELDEVGEALEVHAGTIAKWDALLLERDFLTGLLDLLAPLAEASQKEAEARVKAGTSHEKLRAFAGAVAARVAAEKRVVEAETEHLEDLHRAIETASAEYEEAHDLYLMYQRHAAELRLSEAITVHEALKDTERDCVAVSQSWLAVEPLIRKSKAAAAVIALERVIGERERAARPALDALNTAARVLRRALLTMAERAHEAAEAELVRASEVEQHISAAERDQLKCLTASAEARVLAGDRVERIKAVRTDVRRAEEHGLIPAGSTAQQALAELAQKLAAAKTALDEAVAQESELEELCSTAEETRSLAAIAVSESAQRHRAAAERVSDARERTARLARTPRLTELLAVERIELDADADVLIELLGDSCERAEAKQIDLRVEDAGDARARRALNTSGLLPPSPEAVKTQQLLHAEGILCWTGWDYLAGIPDVSARRALVDRIPLLLDGVMLNDVQDLDEARELLEAAEPRPAGVVPVVGTDIVLDERQASLTTGEVEWAYFVRRPHEALFDPQAGHAEKDALEDRHEHLVAAVDAVVAGLAQDAHLALRLRQWREEFPPGELAALAEAAAEAERVHNAAEREHAESRRALADARAQRLAVRNRLPDLRQSITALDHKHRQLGELARLWRTLPGLERERDEATAAAETQDAVAARIEKALKGLRKAENSHVVAALQHQATAQRARSDLAEVKAGGEVTDDEPEPSEPIATLRDRYDEAQKAYAQAEVGGDLRADLAAAQAEVRAADKELQDYPTDVKRRAKKLLAGVDGSDVESRSAARSRVAGELKQVTERCAEAQQAVADCRAALTQVRKPRLPRQLDDLPTDIGRAEEQVGLASAASMELDARREDRTRSRQSLARQLEERSRGLSGFEVLLTGIPVSVHHDETSSVEPYTLDSASASEIYRTLVAEDRAHRDLVEHASSVTGTCADEVARFASNRRFEKLATPVRDRVVGTPRRDLPKDAVVWLTDLRPRLRSVQDDLEDVGRHRSSLVKRLQGLVDQALRTLTRAQRLSRLPSSLGDWAGEEFLRIRFTALEGDALAHQLGEVIDEAALGKDTSGKPVARDGMSVLLRGVAAAVPKGFRADMLKPDSVLRNEREPVAGVHDVFSGGQQLTAAIVLYCTMAALRANERGRVTNPHSGVLFLDNPIGRASAAYLLDIQRGVAEALGVQLIYTTGLFDADALAGFPVLVRLRNDADVRAHRKYLRVEQYVRAHWDSLSAPDSAAHVTATRMVLRGRPKPDRSPSD